MVEETKDVNESLFNSSIAILRRMDHIKKMIHESRQSGNLVDWFHWCIGLTDELWGKMDEEEKALFDIDGVYVKSIRLRLAAFQSGNKDIKNLSASNELYISLEQYQRKLFEIESKYKIGFADKDDDVYGDGEMWVIKLFHIINYFQY